MAKQIDTVTVEVVRNLLMSIAGGDFMESLSAVHILLI